VTEYPLLVECDAAVAVEISADARTLRDCSMQSRHARNLGESPLHPSRKGIGAADARDADGLTCFTFAQAQERARTFFGRKARELAGHSEPQAGPYTVEPRSGATAP